jgi:hypothetical protein
MKKLITLLTLAIIAACPMASFGEGSIESDPAYLPIDKVIDLKAIPPQVNVNLPRFLLKDALSGLAANSSSNTLSSAATDLPDLLKEVKLIRVVVFETSKTNRAAVDKAVKTLRAELDSKWTAIVSVPENNVGIYAMGDPSGENVAGVAVLVADGNNVVIVNVVGHVSIGKLVKFAAQTNKLPKDLLKALGQGAHSETIPAANADSGAKTNPPADASDKPKEAPATK